jgi:uncharacterized lipoprotein YajG
VRKTLSILAVVLLAGCGSYPLGTSHPQQGQAQAQVDQDILVCKDRAAIADGSSERMAQAAIAGVLPGGLPVTIMESRRYQREVFTQCMTARGYRVEQDGRMP